MERWDITAYNSNIILAPSIQNSENLTKGLYGSRYKLCSSTFHFHPVRGETY